MNARLAWPVVVLAGIGMIAGTVMAIARVDRELIVLVLVGFVGPVLTSMVAAQVQDVRSRTERVERNTNGTQAELLAIIKRQSDQLAASTPVATDKPAQ